MGQGARLKSLHSIDDEDNNGIEVCHVRKLIGLGHRLDPRRTPNQHIWLAPTLLLLQEDPKELHLRLIVADGGEDRTLDVRMNDHCIGTSPWIHTLKPKPPLTQPNSTQNPGPPQARLPLRGRGSHWQRDQAAHPPLAPPAFRRLGLLLALGPAADLLARAPDAAASVGGVCGPAHGSHARGVGLWTREGRQRQGGLMYIKWLWLLGGRMYRKCGD